jgi:hypothetical protein
VAAASVDTNNTRRDTHLRPADFVDGGNYPDITFTGTPGSASSGPAPASPGIRWACLGARRPHHPRRLHPGVSACEQGRAPQVSLAGPLPAAALTRR